MSKQQATKTKTYLFVGISIPLLLIILVYFLNKTYNYSSIVHSEPAVKPIEPEPHQVLVCPENEKDKPNNNCNYFGGNGLAKAINDADKNIDTIIKLKPSEYTRLENSETFTDNEGINQKCFLYSKDKNIKLVGLESDDHTKPIINGRGMDNPMSGICIDGGHFEISNIILKDFLRSTTFCTKEDVDCSEGSGIAILSYNSEITIKSVILGTGNFSAMKSDNSNLAISDSDIAENSDGISLYNGSIKVSGSRFYNNRFSAGYYVNSDVVFQNNIFFENGPKGGMNLYNSNKTPNYTIINNTFYKNTYANLNIEIGYGSDSPFMKITNNIFTDAQVYFGSLGSWGEGIHLEDYDNYLAKKPENFDIGFNLFWKNGNTPEKYCANNYLLCNMKGSIIGKDPLFNNPNEKDFRLKTGSPAINAGANGLTIGAIEQTVDTTSEDKKPAIPNDQPVPETDTPVEASSPTETPSPDSTYNP
ncbi:right-handed parallel beta-helix repeat-containing protein [Candidatus Gottesmanbacteria bacterium]|nr:right-handed parallel beta-helix repeat-containing protein [Candidatus Gottesmanbacteria bacterium]